jgi:hypothetical protein
LTELTRPASGDTLPAMAAFNGLGMGLGMLSRLSTAATRSAGDAHLPTDSSSMQTLPL